MPATPCEHAPRTGLEILLEGKGSTFIGKLNRGHQLPERHLAEFVGSPANAARVDNRPTPAQAPRSERTDP
jgi:hypothetical protein